MLQERCLAFHGNQKHQLQICFSLSFPEMALLPLTGSAS